MSNLETKDYTKLVPYKQDELEVIIDLISGECFASIRSVARMCDVAESTIRAFIKGAALEVIEKARINTPSGTQGARLLTEDSILECIAKYNSKLLLQFAKLGLRKFLHTTVGFKTKDSRYPQRSIEYKLLYNMLMDLMKQSDAKKHNYIHLQQALNRVLDNQKGRAGLIIPPTLDYAYCQALKAACREAKACVDKGNHVPYNVISKLDKLAPRLKSIKTNIEIIEAS